MKMARKKTPSINPLLATSREYCERSTPHGFNYWVTCTKISDRIFWVVTVMIGLPASPFFARRPSLTGSNHPHRPLLMLLASQYHRCVTLLSACARKTASMMLESTSGQCSTTFSLPAKTASLPRVAKLQLC
jgi:hypothetical protein